MTARGVVYAEQGFPLKIPTIQRCIATPEMLAAVVVLDDAGVQGLPQSSQFSFRFGLASRDVTLSVRLPTGIFTPAEASPLFDVSKLTADERAALISWLERSLKERRLVEMVNNTTRLVIDSCKCTGDIMARWPFLATVVTDGFWRARLHAAPTRLTPYMWPAHFTQSTEGVLMLKRMAASELVLTRATLLTDITLDPEKINANISSWTRLDSDPKW